MDSESLFKNCVVCRKQISKSASLCPHCGHKNTKSYKLKIVVIICVGLFIVGSLNSNNDTKTQVVSSQSSGVNKDTSSENKVYPEDRWEQDVSVSKIDDSTSVTLRLTANNEIKSWMISSLPDLYIRCKEKATDVFIDVKTSADIENIYGNHTVEIRLDKNTAFKQQWSASTDNNALFSPNPVDLSKKIAGAEKMVVRFTPFNASPQIIEFDVAGLGQHLELVAKTCKWSYTNNKEKE